MTDYFELQTYDTAAVAWDKRAMRKQASGEATTFVRRTKLVLQGRTGEIPAIDLDKIFEMSAVAFEDLAYYCGAQVVKHTWGIAEAPAGYRIDTLERSLLPSGTALVAAVDVIRNLRPLEDAEAHNVGIGIDAHKNAAAINNQPYCRDMYRGDPRQNIVYGDIPGHPNSLIVVDIEPRITVPRAY